MKDKLKERVKFIFDTIEKAGVSMTDFARIVGDGASRETLYRWKSGANIADGFRLNFVYSVAVRLSKAVHLGRLPLKDKLKAVQRLAVLREIVKSMSAK